MAAEQIGHLGTRFDAPLMPPFRAATRDDAPVLAHLINLAGAGLPMHLWRGLAAKDPGYAGCTPFEVGVIRCRREEGAFAYRRAVVIEAPRPDHAVGHATGHATGHGPGAAEPPRDLLWAGPEVAGMLIGYRQDVPYVPADPGELAAPLRPLLALEAEAERIAEEAGAPGTWYLNVLAVLPPYQGRGLGARLLAQAETLARASGAAFASLIVEGDNRVADTLYRSRGYRETARRPISPWPNGPTGDWVLLLKAL